MHLLAITALTAIAGAIAAAVKIKRVAAPVPVRVRVTRRPD